MNKSNFIEGCICVRKFWSVELEIDKYLSGCGNTNILKLDVEIYSCFTWKSALFAKFPEDIAQKKFCLSFPLTLTWRCTNYHKLWHNTLGLCELFKLREREKNNAPWKSATWQTLFCQNVLMQTTYWIRDA